MPKRPPPHELRARWMTAIAASFHPITVFRFTRTRALDVTDLMEQLDWEMVTLERLEGTYLSGIRASSFWRGIYQTLEVLDTSYVDMLKRLSETEWTWWQKEDKAHQCEFRIRKESMIKHLAIYDWVLVLLQKVVYSSFRVDRPWFLDIHHISPNNKVLQRRFSWQVNGDYEKLQSCEKTSIDRAILRWSASLEDRLSSSVLDMHRYYNEGKIYEHYVRQIQWNNEEEKKSWGNDGIRWPYPDYTLKLDGIDVPGSKFLQRHWPSNGVPVWEEDTDLRNMFS